MSGLARFLETGNAADFLQDKISYTKIELPEYIEKVVADSKIVENRVKFLQSLQRLKSSPKSKKKGTQNKLQLDIAHNELQLDIAQGELRLKLAKLLLQAVLKLIAIHTDEKRALQNYAKPCIFVLENGEILLLDDDENGATQAKQEMGVDMYMLIRDFSFSVERARDNTVSRYINTDSYPFDGIEHLFSEWFKNMYTKLIILPPDHRISKFEAGILKAQNLLQNSMSEQSDMTVMDLKNDTKFFRDKSSIDGAGDGIFAKMPIFNYANLGKYDGTFYTNANFIRMSMEQGGDKQKFINYALGVADSVTGISTHTIAPNAPNFDTKALPNSNILNDGEGNMDPNKRIPNNCAFLNDGTIMTIVPINGSTQKPVELLIGYGETYWANQPGGRAYTKFDKDLIAQVSDVDVQSNLVEQIQTLKAAIGYLKMQQSVAHEYSRKKIRNQTLSTQKINVRVGKPRNHDATSDQIEEYLTVMIQNYANKLVPFDIINVGSLVFRKKGTGEKDISTNVLYLEKLFTAHQNIRGIILAGTPLTDDEVTFLIKAVPKSGLIDFKLTGEYVNRQKIKEMQNVIQENRDRIKMTFKTMNKDDSLELEKICAAVDNYSGGQWLGVDRTMFEIEDE